MLCEEELISLEEAGKRVPGRGRSKPTIWRWCDEGDEGVLLEHLRIGREMFTSEAAVKRYFTAVTAAKLARRRRSCEQAGKPVGLEVKCELPPMAGPVRRRRPEDTAAILARAGI